VRDANAFDRLIEEIVDVTRGYLRARAADLPEYERRLRELIISSGELRPVIKGPVATDMQVKFDPKLLPAQRASAIYKAILWGIRFPSAWDAGLAPYKFERRPRLEGPPWNAAKPRSNQRPA
jgi:hypothetical protein